MAVSRRALYCSTAAEPEVAPVDQPQTVVEGLLYAPGAGVVAI